MIGRIELPSQPYESRALPLSYTTLVDAQRIELCYTAVSGQSQLPVSVTSFAGVERIELSLLGLEANVIAIRPYPLASIAAS